MNYNQFPERLEPHIEAQLLERFTSSYDADARKELLEHNLRLVARFANKFLYTGIEVEEFISVGTIGLIKALDTFNPQKEASFATYASRCIENEMLTFLRCSLKHSKLLHLEDIVAEDSSGDALTLGDIIADAQAEEEIYGYEKAESFTCRVCTALNQLSLMEIEIALLYAGGYTQNQIANMMEFSQRHISGIMQKFIIRSRREHHLCITMKNRDIFFDTDSDGTFCAMVNSQFMDKLENLISYDGVKVVDLSSGYTKFKLPINEDSYKFYAAMARILRTA